MDPRRKGDIVPTIADITGLWRRSLIKWPDGRSDTTTSVRWMQTPTLYVDLRQPADRPSFNEVRCLRELSRENVEWLARQEAFAGEIRFDGVYFEWLRQIDLQPATAFADAGRFWFESDMMVEEGRDSPYIEHWHREANCSEACSGIRMREVSTGRTGIIVRSGDLFMYARRRPIDMPPRCNLIECIGRTSELPAAQDLIDCEISFGRIEAAGWRIENSSLPFKENRLLGPQTFELSKGRLKTVDVAPGGESIDLTWDIMGVQGSLNDVIGCRG
jgi:hypothetical protein